MTEQWRPAVGYEGRYEVSDQGRVRSLDRLVAQGNRWGGVSHKPCRGQMLKPGLDTYGYAQVSMEGQRILVHHLVLAAFGSPRPEGWTGDHCNGKRDDNRIDNLRWASPSDNARNKHVVLNRTGYIGVSENPKGGPNPYWATARNRDGKKVFLGMYPTAEAASAAYLSYRETQFSHA